MAPVIIGMDPHKRSATVEITNGREQVLDTGRFGTDRDGYRRMLAVGHEHKGGSGLWRAARASGGTWLSAWSPARP